MKKIILPFLCCLLAAGCANRYSLAGRGPDEYTVLSKPPLSLPPDFTLRAPVAAKAAPKPDDSIRKAESALVGRKDAPASEASPASLSSGENALLNQTGKGDGDIRGRLEEESRLEEEDARYLEKKIREWQSESGQPLDADKEAGELHRKGIKTTGNPAAGTEAR